MYTYIYIYINVVLPADKHSMSCFPGQAINVLGKLSLPVDKLSLPAAKSFPFQRTSFRVRPVFKSSIWETGCSPWEIRTFKGHLEVNISDGSGIRDPRFKMLRIRIP